jgi:hypothetical protein
MKASTSIAAVLYSLSITATASVVNFWAGPNCEGALEIESIDFPSERGCSLLNLAGGSTALSAKAPNKIPNDCAIELYKDASCKKLEAVFDWGVDQGGKFERLPAHGFAYRVCVRALTSLIEVCNSFNPPGPIAYQTFCGLGDKRRRSRRALAPVADHRE